MIKTSAVGLEELSALGWGRKVTCTTHRKRMTNNFLNRGYLREDRLKGREEWKTKSYPLTCIK